VKTEGVIKNGQSRENGTLGTQETGQRQTQQIIISENRRSNQEWTIQRKWQHWVHKKQDKDKHNK
jgi:hypothetical protein